MPKIIYNKSDILNAYHNRHELGVTIRQISLIYNIDPKTINNYRHKNLDFINSNFINKVSFMHALSDDLINYIIIQSIDNPYFNINRLRHYIKIKFKKILTKHQIYCILKFNNVTYKKAVRKTKMKNKTDIEIKKEIDTVLDKISKINKNNNKDNVVFIDETHVDISEIKKYGWSKKGYDVIYDDIVPNKILNKRFTVIAAVSKTNKIGYKIIKGSVNGETFNNYINYISRKTKLNNYYLDNARIHHYKKVKTTMKYKRINVIYGVPYNSQLNIIENFFRSFKTKIRNTNLNERTNIEKIIRKCWKSVNNEVMVNTYNHIYTKREG
jgi:hypothetical protein